MTDTTAIHTRRIFDLTAADGFLYIYIFLKQKERQASF